MTTPYSMAYELARTAHAGQVDKAGNDYFAFHLLEVATIVRDKLGGDTEAQIAALLHDVVEDTPVTVEEVIEQFGPDVGADVEALSHRKHEPYVEYIDRIRSRGGRAVTVKHADLLDHLYNGNTIPEHLTEKYERSLVQLLA